MSNLNSIKSYKGFKEGMYVTRKGRLGLIKKIHFEMHPASVTVLMMDNNTEVGTEFDRLKHIKSWFCAICTAKNTDNAANSCCFCKSNRTFKEKIIINEEQENDEKDGKEQQKQKEPKKEQQECPETVEIEQEDEEEEEYEEASDEEELSQSMNDKEEKENHYKYDDIEDNMDDNYYRNRYYQYPQYNRNNKRFRNNYPSPFMKMFDFW